ncbi:MAG TPA: GMP synthase [Parafilimonas sp.]|nr:GMP synthase [Parafilimonas sp.]
MNQNDRIIKIAILDLYEGAANQGMRCLQQIVDEWTIRNNKIVQLDIFDVRSNLQIPDLSYDVFISSGGPGSPLDTSDLEWDKRYMQWIESVESFNNDYANYPKKHIFFICHSFQLACRYFKIATVCKRNSTAFGTFPVHMTRDGKNEIVFSGMKDPFYAVDSRDFQVIEPNHNRLHEMGAKILAIEKERPHVAHYERAIMAIRFNDYFIGTQFHPEADALGMTVHLHSEERKETVIKNYGEAKWKSMIEHLNDPDKILWTYSHIIPNFLNIAVEELVED